MSGCYGKGLNFPVLSMRGYIHSERERERHCIGLAKRRRKMLATSLLRDPECSEMNYKVRLCVCTHLPYNMFLASKLCHRSCGFSEYALLFYNVMCWAVWRRTQTTMQRTTSSTRSQGICAPKNSLARLSDCALFYSARVYFKTNSPNKINV